MRNNRSERVETSTPEKINIRIEEQTLDNVREYSYSTPEQISERLKELDQEWDVERLLELNAASFSLVGVILGFAVNKKWLALPAVVTGFLIQHSIQGWCPPLSLFRRLGVRTRKEIEWEKNSLKALRGDYNNISNDSGKLSPDEVFNAAKKQ
jgi:hypothetical protein